MLNRQTLEKYILDTYGVSAEAPWIQYPDNTVYRHASNKKWFAVVMTLPKSKLGLPEDAPVDVINLKCGSILIGSLVGEKGIFPAYHMNKAYWVTVLLDGTVEDEKLKWLLDVSFDLTDKPIKSQRKSNTNAQ